MAQECNYLFDISEYKSNIKNIFTQSPTIKQFIVSEYTNRDGVMPNVKETQLKLNANIDKLMHNIVDDAISLLMEWTLPKNLTNKASKDIVNDFFGTLCKSRYEAFGDKVKEQFIYAVDKEIDYAFNSIKGLLINVLGVVNAPTVILGVPHIEIVSKTWDMWIFEIKGSTVSLVNSGDYRIFEWENTSTKYDKVVEDLLIKFSVPSEQRPEITEYLYNVLETHLSFKPV